MSVRLNIHKTHRRYTNGKDVVEVEGKTAGGCLGALTKEFPGMQKVLFDSKGELLNTVEVYVSGKSAYPNELARSVRDGMRSMW